MTTYADQYYTDTAGKLCFLSAQDQANAVAHGLSLPASGWTPITPEQAATLQAPTTVQLTAAYVASVRAALTEADKTMDRIAEAVALGLNSWVGADVVEFVTYRRALRAIITSAPTAPGTVPTRAPYPAGT